MLRNSNLKATPFAIIYMAKPKATRQPIASKCSKSMKMPVKRSNNPSKKANMDKRMDSKFIKLINSKKAQGMEILFIVILIIGLVVALMVKNLVLTYLIVVVSGLGMGFLLYQKRNELRGKYMIACLSFIIGYIVANSGIRIRLVIVFMMSIVFGYLIYKQFLKTRINDYESLV